MVDETPAPFSLAAVLRGEEQVAFSRRLGAGLSLYAPAIRVRNQIEYSIFGLPNAPSVAFGEDKYLYESPYINEYCGRTGEINAAILAAWADKIKDIMLRDMARLFFI